MYAISGLQTEAAREQTDQDLYLDDVLDSAGEPASPSTPVDPSVETATKADRLAKITASLLKDLDTDQSGQLSLEEFLAAPKARAEKRQCSSDIAEKMEAKMTEDFKKYAGDDGQLSSSELTTLLTEAGPRVGKHRSEHHRGGHGPRQKQSFSQVTDQFDADKDGKLNQQEFETWQASRPTRSGKKHGPGPRP